MLTLAQHNRPDTDPASILERITEERVRLHARDDGGDLHRGLGGAARLGERALLLQEVREVDVGRGLQPAIALNEQTLATQEARLGPGHPNALFTQSTLAVAYADNRQFDLAIPLLEHLDSTGATRRMGDDRMVVRSAAKAAG